MNKDQVEGRFEEAKGKVKSVAGKAVDNDKLRAEGQADQLAGKAQKNYGDGKEKLKDVADRTIDKL